MDASLWEKYPLLNTMMKLRKARFNAAERLGHRYKWHSMALVVFSIYVLALSIVPKYLVLQIQTVEIINFVSVVSSVFTLVLSVYSAFSEDVVRGKYLHDNAKQVTNLYHKYKIAIDDFESKDGDQPNNMLYEEKYNAIMDACPYNHDQIDYQSIRSELEKLSPWEKFNIGFQAALGLYFWPVLAIAVPPVLIGLGIFFFGFNQPTPG